MTDAVVTLKKGEGRYLQKGGPWIYNNEIADISPGAEDGGLVRVCGENGWPLGQGFLNRRSKLTVRMLTRDPDAEINEDFFLMRLKNAWEYRKKVVDTSSCRLVFGEADFLPGLVVDKFSDVLVVESLALGIDRFKVTIVELLKELLAQDGIAIRGVYERSDAKVRLQEGMERYKGFLGAPFDTKVEIVENGVRYFVDVKDGQKTGFFLDQKYNRQAVGRLCRGPGVLDCFTHTGSFALNAGICGAEHVIGVDASELGGGPRPGRTQPSTCWRTGWSSSARMCSTCSPSWRPGKTLSGWTALCPPASPASLPPATAPAAPSRSPRRWAKGSSQPCPPRNIWTGGVRSPRPEPPAGPDLLSDQIKRKEFQYGITAFYQGEL